MRVKGMVGRVSKVSGVSCCSIPGVRGSASTTFNPDICRPLNLRRSLPSLPGVAGFSTRRFLKLEDVLGRRLRVCLSPILAVSGSGYLSISTASD